MILSILMIAAAALYRLMPHPGNLAPIAALALVGGIHLGRRYALWVPLAAVAVTDLVLNAQMGYPLLYWPRLIDYAAFTAVGLLGLWVRQNKTSAKLGAALATPFLFFALSNFGVWLFGLNLENQPYPKTLAGLADCYAAGLPFLRGTVTGDWAFMALFVGAMWMVRRARAPRWQWLVAEAKV